MDAPNFTFDAFVSYCHADSEWVHDWLIPGLQRHRVRVCYDYGQFRRGENIAGAILAAMTQSRVTILVFTTNYLNSEWTKYEQNTSVNAAIVNGLRTIPLLLGGDCVLPMAFRFLVPADFSRDNKSEGELRQLAASIKSDKPVAIISSEEPQVPSRYRNFDIELEPSEADRYHMRAGCEQINATTEDVVTLATADMHADLERIRNGTADRFVCESVGRKLYGTIFTPAVQELWNHTAETSRTGDVSVLRLRLRLLDRRAAMLPWELLYNDSFHLAMVGQNPIVRSSGDVHMPARTDAQTKVNILLAETAPRKERNVDEEMRAVEPRLQKLQGDKKIGELGVLRASSLPHLQSALRSKPYDVVHVIAEAEQRNGMDGLLLRDHLGLYQHVDGETFAYYFRESPVRLLVLSAASPGTSEPQSLGVVAADVSGAGVPAVVALPGNVSLSAATAFCDFFYEVLADGCPVEACMSEGRKAIMTAAGMNSAQWAMPLLFNDEPDALMFAGEPPKNCFGTPYSGRRRRAAPGRELPGERGSGETRHNVAPGFHQRLIGRDDAIRRVWAAFNTGGVNNVVLLKGAAGFGKTAVAREIAWQAVQRGASGGPSRPYDSVIWISSSSPQATDPNDVLRRASHQITGEDLAVAVVDVFRQRQLLKIEPSARLREIAALMARGRHLIVIDDVSTPAHDAVRRFIEAMPRTVQVVVTSPRRLGIGELEVEIGPLTAADGRALAMRVATSAGGELSAEASTSGGNPFVIIAETKRALLPSMKSIGEILPGREAIATSDYVRALLPVLPMEWRRVLAVAVSVPFATAPSIIRATSELDEGGFKAASESLLRIGLIEDQGGRFALCSTLRALFRDGDDIAQRMLPDVLRPSVPALMQFLNEARSHAGGNHSSALFMNTVEPELGNLLWGVQTAYTTGQYTYLKGFREFLEHTLYRIGTWTAALDMGEMCFIAANRIGDATEMAWAALYPLARIHYHSGNLRECERWCATAMPIFESQHNLNGLLSAKRYLGRVRQSEGDFDAARALFEEILQQVRRIHATHYDVASAIESLASLEQTAGNLAEAEALFQSALAHYGPDADADSVSPTLHQLGRLALTRKDFDAALDYLYRARDLLGKGRWRNRFARIMHSIGLVYEQRNDFAGAREQFRIAREIFSGLGAKTELAETDAAIVRVGALHARHAR